VHVPVESRGRGGGCAEKKETRRGEGKIMAREKVTFSFRPFLLPQERKRKKGRNTDYPFACEEEE